MAAVNLGATIRQAADSAMPFEGIAGETILAGQAVYENLSDGRIYLASCANVTSATKVGHALNGAGVGQPVKVHYRGGLESTATIVKGTAYFLSATPGSICPFADLVSGNFVVYMGKGDASSMFGVNPDVRKPVAI